MKIAQISDVHIRNFQRHSEFKTHFDNLYCSLRQQNPDIIVLVGDAAHTKTHISPEFVQLCSEYFRNLAAIAPLVVIPGNHDCNLSNLSRLDALTPIIEALDNKRIYYYKNSGVYPLPDGMAGQLVVFSCLDENWPTRDDISRSVTQPDAPVIGLYHGMVCGAVLQNGQVVEDCPYTLDQFLEVVDYLLLGDIHKMQILDFDYRAAYAGSLIQQNFGEQVNKGYLLWSIRGKDDHDVDFVSLPNVCPFYTIEVSGDLDVGGKLPLQKGAKLRVFSRQLSPSEESTLRQKLTAYYEPQDLIFKDNVNAHRQQLVLDQGATIEDLVDVGVQEKLIRKFLEPYELTDDMMNQVLALNEKYDSAVRQEESVLRNVKYKITKLRWSNFGPYGDNNEFDFSSHRGLVGIFGRSGVGKSFLAVDLLLYVIFNTNSKKVTKNDEFINGRKDSCEVEIFIEAADKIYRINRKTKVCQKSGKRKGKSVYQGRTDVDFKIVDAEGNVIEDKNGLERSDTDKEIRKVFGTASDFMTTSVAPQWRLLEFIEKKNTERQKMLGRYFDIDAFYKKYDLANEDSKELRSEIRFLEKANIAEDLAVKNEASEKMLVAISELKKKRKIIRSRTLEVEGKIRVIQETVVAIPVGQDSEGLDWSISAAKKRLAEKKIRVGEVQDEKQLLENEFKLMKPVLREDVVKVADQTAQLVEQRRKTEGSLIELERVGEALRRLGVSIEKFKQCTCEHDSGCCMIEELDSLLAESLALKSKKALLIISVEQHRVCLSNIKKLDDQAQGYEEALDNLHRLKLSISDVKCTLSDKKELVVHSQRAMGNLIEKRKIAEDYKIQHKENRDKQDRIDSLESFHVHYRSELRILTNRFVSLEKQYLVGRSEIERLEGDAASLEERRVWYEACGHFLKAVGKEGLPQSIVHNNLGIINKEIAKILSGKVPFDIELEVSDTGKAIEILFKHDRSKPLKIEVCGGAEKSIAAVALRASFVNVTTLPHPDIFVLDEAFTFLDLEYVDAANKILQKLKTMFSLVINITHLDEFKDMVDFVVEVERNEDGFAEIGN